jgi:uncharacterized protein (DUF1499 family)
MVRKISRAENRLPKDFIFSVRVSLEKTGLILSMLFFVGVIASPGALAEGLESPKSVIRPCPDKPNCVTSQAPRGPRRMEPLLYEGSLQEARQRLLAIIRSFPRTTVVQDSDYYLRVEFRSSIFSFVDDVEFEFDDVAKLVHFRSASRVGYYDFGVNRRRMATVTRQFSGD